MTLSNENIKEELYGGGIDVQYDGSYYIGPSSMDFHLWPNLLVSETGGKVKVDEEGTYPNYSYKKGLTIGPGEFVLATTEENVSLSEEFVGYVQGRSSVGRLGLQVENAGLVDAGFNGQITLELKNQEDYWIELVPGMRICQMTFHRHENVPDVGYSNQGKYQGQEGPTPSKLYEDFQ